jgi:hypothetical protein
MGEAPTMDRASEAPAAVAFQCAVSADLVRRALLVASSDETRFYLQGVHISPHPERGGYIVATNGAALICFHDPKAIVAGQAILMPDEALRGALKAQRGDRRPRLLLARTDRLVVAEVNYEEADEALAVPSPLALAAQFHQPVIEAAYPDWRKIVFPIQPDAPVPQVDARQLNLIGKALSEGKRSFVNLRSTGDTRTHTVWVFGQLKGGFGLLAASKDPGPATEQPAWLVFAEPAADSAPKAGA